MNEFFATIAKGESPTLDAIVQALGPSFTLFEQMKATPQDPEWHAEGDVRRHTEMVLEECYGQIALQGEHLTPNQRLSLVLGAALHDIAKPLTTRRREINGVERVVAPHHADIGRSWIAYKLAALNLPLQVRNDIMMLVGHHHDPLKLVRTEAPTAAYRRLARLSNLELLYHLEVADLKGRICNDLQQQLDSLEMFRLYAEEGMCWDGNNPYKEWEEVIADGTNDCEADTTGLILANAIRNAEAGLIATPHEEIARSYSYRNSYPELIVLFGPSGSGKSTWAAARSENYHIISPDTLREEIAGKRQDQRRNGEVFQVAKERLKEHLRRHDKVIWDATSLYKDQRSAVIELGMRYHALVTLVVFCAPEQSIYEQNKSREYPVPDAVLERQLQRLNFPYIDEAHRVIYINESGQD